MEGDTAARIVSVTLSGALRDSKPRELSRLLGTTMAVVTVFVGVSRVVMLHWRGRGGHQVGPAADVAPGRHIAEAHLLRRRVSVDEICFLVVDALNGTVLGAGDWVWLGLGLRFRVRV